MLIYEKDNKLNINFENSVDGEPDLQIGKDEIKLGETEINSDNVLPPTTIEDIGKIVSVMEDGSYGLVPFQEPTGTIEITENGIVDVADYASANVQVPNPSSGSISITQNGTYDVTEKASAVVNVKATAEMGEITVTNKAGQIIYVDSYCGEIDSNGMSINSHVTISTGATASIPISFTKANFSYYLSGVFYIYAPTGMSNKTLSVTSDTTGVSIRELDTGTISTAGAYIYVIISCSNAQTRSANIKVTST